MPVSTTNKDRELIILYDYTLAGGSGRPIYNYYKHALATSDKKIVLLRLASRNSFIKLLYQAFVSQRIIVNGISCFRYWPVLLVCFLKKNLIIYLHEAAPHVEPFAKRAPFKFRLFISLLRKRKVAFVSEWQRQYFLQFTAVPKYKIVYNNITFPYTRPSNPNVTAIAMVGYQNDYKNVSFFSKVADASAKKKLPYQFMWVGGRVGGKDGKMKEPYHSENVLWLGDQEHVMDTLNSIDVLLFTSYGDTFGLVITEALFKGKRIVSYKENGLAPFIEKLQGCRVYDRFDEALVLNLLNEVVQEAVDLDAHKELCLYLCSMENFEDRLNDLFELPD